LAIGKPSPLEAHIQNLEIYGQDHSPWVQAVLLGLHEKDIPHTLTAIPPLAVFLKSGVMMPAARIDGAPWQLESADILRQVGFDEVSKEDLKAIHDAWLGVAHRAKSAPRFFSATSRSHDPDPVFWRRLRNQFLRSFVVLYFYLLLQFVIRAGVQPDPKDFAEQFLYWEEKLRDSPDPYLGGDTPNTLDFMLFGVVQCHSSIPVPPLTALGNDSRLVLVRSWISEMQRRFTDYPHLYSGAYFAPNAGQPEPATGTEQAAFWLGLAVMIVAFPLTVTLVAFLASRVPRGGRQD
jgi:glutathione S-transferase